MRADMARTVFRANSPETYIREIPLEGTEQLATMMKLLEDELPGVVSDLRELNDRRRKDEKQHGKAPQSIARA